MSEEQVEEFTFRVMDFCKKALEMAVQQGFSVPEMSQGSILMFCSLGHQINMPYEIALNVFKETFEMSHIGYQKAKKKRKLP